MESIEQVSRLADQGANDQLWLIASSHLDAASQCFVDALTTLYRRGDGLALPTLTAMLKRLSQAKHDAHIRHVDEHISFTAFDTTTEALLFRIREITRAFMERIRFTVIH